VGLALEVILRMIKRKSRRLLLVGLVIVLFLLVWAELAVGLFGTPFA